MLESTPFSEKLRNAQWKPTQDVIMRLVPFLSNRTISLLANSPTLHDVFEHDDTSGTLWRVREESETLKAHFPEQGDISACGIAPLTSMITLLAVKQNKTSFRCTIGEPLLAGDVIRVTSGGIQLVKKDGNEGSFIVQNENLQSGDTMLGQDIHLPSDITLNQQESIELPQGESFQFVTAARTSEGHRFFTGTYRIPTTFRHVPFGNVLPFDIGLLPEVVAQTGAAVGKNLLKKGELFVYEGGVFNFDTNIELMEGESLRTTAQLTRNEGGKISYLYCLRRSRDEKPLLWGQVDATSIEYTRLLKMAELLKKRRAKGK